MDKTGGSLWEDIYKEGRMLNKAPYDSVVSAIFHHMPKNTDKASLNILEVGCGSGINILFAAEQGYKVAGVDISPTAVNYAKAMFAAKNLEADIYEGNFYPLKFGDGYFDFVIDRGALSCIDKTECLRSVKEISRVIKKGGKFFFSPYSDRHSGAVSGKAPNGRAIGGYRLTSIGGGIQEYGKLFYYSSGDIQEILNQADWKIINMNHIEKFDYMAPKREIFGCWEVIAEKK